MLMRVKSIEALNLCSSIQTISISFYKATITQFALSGEKLKSLRKKMIEISVVEVFWVIVFIDQFFSMYFAGK